MRLRPHLLGVEEIKVRTFHALGLELLASDWQRKPSVSNFAAGHELGDSVLMDSLIAEEMTRDSEFAADWLTFLAVCPKPLRDPVEFESTADWDRFVQTNGAYRDGNRGFLTMNRELVKSQGELAI